jgi:hypothetical protein
VTIAASLMVSHAIFTILPLRLEFDDFIQIRLSHRGTIFPKQTRAACPDFNLRHGRTVCYDLSHTGGHLWGVRWKQNGSLPCDAQRSSGA